MKSIVAAIGCFGALLAGIWWLVHPWPWLGPDAWFFVMGGVWVLFGLGVWFLRRVPKRLCVALVLLGGAALPLAAAFAPPRSSDDLYRYIWDGRVQVAGIDPYRYPPEAEELRFLRDDFLWPQESAWCVPSGCSLINRPHVRTIYPPTAQAYFTGVELLSPKGSRELPIQLASVLFGFAASALLVLVSPRWAALWAWCPLVALESGNNAHLDVVAAFLVAAALVAAARARTWRGSASGALLLGLAIATKFTPALVGVGMLKRRPLLIAGGAVLTVALLYLPHVLAVGPGVLGYLPDYLHAEGYGTGTRFALLAMVFPPSTAAVAAVLILLATAAWALWRSDPDRPWDTAVVMAGVFLLVSTPGYAWYTMLVVVLAALSGRAEWLTVAVAGYVAQYATNLHLHGIVAQQIGYGAAALIVIIVGSARVWHVSPRFSEARG